ncbi:MAG TPA: ABC transporter ATP-binding protein [Sphingobium sp.]
MSLLAPDRRLLTAAAVLLVFATLGNLSGPWILRLAIDHGLSGPTPDLTLVGYCALAYLTIAFAAMFAGRGQIRLIALAGERFLRRLRERTVSHVLAQSIGFHDRNPAGRVVARMTSDIDALQDLLQLGFGQFVQAVVTLCLLIGLLLALSWKLALLSLLSMPLLIMATLRFQRRSRGAYVVVRERVGEAMSALIESLSGVKVVQAFAQERQRIAHFERHNDALLAANIASVKTQASYLPMVEGATTSSIVLAVAGGGWLAARGEVSVGTIAAFALYLTLAFEPIQQLSFLVNQIQSAQAALAKIFALLDEPLDRPGGTSQLAARQELRLSSVGFRYAPHLSPVLSGIDLTLRHGERLALVGPTGAGKSTLAKLIAGLADPTEGHIRYGGVDLREAGPAALRRHIVMLAQEGHLFHGSIADNLRAARPAASDAELEEALRRIGVWERFAGRPRGLLTPVGERGAQLSSGERQLIGLARIALLDADLLVLDEPTATLDPATEALVNRALERLMRDRTVVLVAHRLSTMSMIDRIALVDEGMLAELGTHDELMAKEGRYARLYHDWSHAASGADGTCL